MAILTFLSSTTGRAVRVVAGLILIAVGILLGGAGYVLAVVGLVPLAAGALDVCILAPLARMPFAGPAFREVAAKR